MKIEPFPGTLTKKPLRHNSMGYALTDNQREWLCKWFPEVENGRLMEASGMSHSTLHRLARELGLAKSPKGWKRIKKRQAAHVKKTCEENGYYDSIRGKKPSLQCREATARMWQEIREGKREHPTSIMKRKNPRRYRKWMQRKSEERKETIRKENLRVLYGLERKTRLKCIVMCPYTRSQTSHRYNALRRGYIIIDDTSEQGGERYNIYYDNDTKRSPAFEKNLFNDGFHILPFDE